MVISCKIVMVGASERAAAVTKFIAHPAPAG
jgi:hypothetical protein